MGELLESVGRRSRFLGERRVLLRGFFKIDDRIVDLNDRRALLLGRRCDRADELRDPGNTDHHFRRGLARVRGEFRARVHPRDRIGDQRLDLRGGFGRALREGANLTGHDGEAAALVSRAGGLDGGVERQDVRLEGDRVYDADDLADLVRTCLDALHHLRYLAHRRAAALRGASRRDRCFMSAKSVFGVLIDRRRDLLYRGCHFLET